MEDCNIFRKPGLGKEKILKSNPPKGEKRVCNIMKSELTMKPRVVMTILIVFFIMALNDFSGEWAYFWLGLVAMVFLYEWDNCKVKHP